MKSRFFAPAAVGLLLTAVILLSSFSGKYVTVMTYNVGAFGKYTKSSVKAVAKIIRASGADIVGLNETDSCNIRHNTFQVKDLAKRLGWDYSFARALRFGGGSYGNGVVSSEKILSSYSIDLPKASGAETRSVSVVETEDLVFASVHLDYKTAEAQFAQLKVLNDHFSSRYTGYGKPVILCGDFNALPESPVMQSMDSLWTKLSVDDLTFPSKDPVKCIDYIYVLSSARGVKVNKVRVIHNKKASDHIPVVVRLRILPQ